MSVGGGLTSDGIVGGAVVAAETSPASPPTGVEVLLMRTGGGLLPIGAIVPLIECTTAGKEGFWGSMPGGGGAAAERLLSPAADEDKDIGVGIVGALLGPAPNAARPPPPKTDENEGIGLMVGIGLVEASGAGLAT